tara:strand:+ start:2607 stop:3059 length:453 start_codon:yes stop_codon:yes gene_type:complete
MIIKSLEKLNELSKLVSNKISNSEWIFLFGEIGVGKTTFSRFLINNIQKKNNIETTDVKSPTFNILIEYKIKDITISHYDFYRLKKLKEIDDLGILSEEENNIKIIEWPELLSKKIKDRIEIHFKYQKNKDFREISIKSFGQSENKIHVL